MLILGVDPGLAKTGWGVIHITGNEAAYVDGGVIHTAAATPHIDRLRSIGERLRQIQGITKPELICVERVFINANPKSSLLLGEARGAALMALSPGGTPIMELSALQIKQSLTGRGRANKRQVAMMVERALRRPDESLSGDCADALACALAAAAVVRSGGNSSGGIALRRGARRRRRA